MNIKLEHELEMNYPALYKAIAGCYAALDDLEQLLSVEYDKARDDGWEAAESHYDVGWE